MNNGFGFWKTVDRLNPYKTMSQLAEAAGLNHTNIKQQRSDCRIPKAEDLYRIAVAIGVHMETLLTGTDEKSGLSPEASYVKENPAMKTHVRYCIDGRTFWETVDSVSPYKRLADFAKDAGMAYNTVRQQRTDGTLPKADDLYRISKVLHRSMEFLLTGSEQHMFSARVERIAWHCENVASEEELFVIEKVLGIDSHKKVLFQDENRRESGVS